MGQTYEDRLVAGRGDRYNELYLGANDYFYGYKLKLQSGLQVADMKDRVNDGGAYSGVSWTTGLRVGWSRLDDHLEVVVGFDDLNHP